jgi:hypothetical protein
MLQTSVCSIEKDRIGSYCGLPPVLPRYTPAGNREKHDKPLSVQQVTPPSLEMVTLRTQV